MPSPSTPRRPAARREHILEQLRRQIVLGKVAPGAVLPKRAVLERRYDASPTTVQAVFDRLINDGFVEVRPRRGTFVTNHPPHLCRYAIAFVHKRGDAATLFQDAIASAAEGISRRDPRRQFSLYYEIDGHTDREGYRSLVADLQARRLAGLIFATHPGPLIGSPLLANDGVPRISIASDDVWLTTQGVLSHTVQGDAFMERAFTLASQAGARRVAVLWRADAVPNWQKEMNGLMSSAEALGLGLERRHIQVPTLGHPNSIYHSVYGLLDDAPDRRPDLLIISDDNLVEEATKAIVQTGVRVPQELQVITHCNYPTLPPAAVPVVRLGFDIRVLLGQCVVALDGRRVGQEPSRAVSLPPLLEEELATNKSLSGITA